MANIELIDKDRKGPGTAICPHCRQKMIIDINLFRDNVAKVVQQPCPYCKQQIFSCILVLSQVNIDRLMGQVQLMIDAVQKGGGRIIQ